jgi:hypothetical protein
VKSALNSELAAHLRPLTHEQLAVLAAHLALALEDIAHNRVDSAIESADRALRDTCIEVLQQLVTPSCERDAQDRRAELDSFHDDGGDRRSQW